VSHKAELMCRVRNHSRALRNRSLAQRSHNRKLRDTASRTSRRDHRRLIQAVVVAAVRVKAKSRNEDRRQEQSAEGSMKMLPFCFLL
jgi:hypothetical protein